MNEDSYIRDLLSDYEAVLAEYKAKVDLMQALANDPHSDPGRFRAVSAEVEAMTEDIARLHARVRAWGGGFPQDALRA